MCIVVYKPAIPSFLSYQLSLQLWVIHSSQPTVVPALCVSYTHHMASNNLLQALFYCTLHTTWLGHCPLRRSIYIRTSQRNTITRGDDTTRRRRRWSRNKTLDGHFNLLPSAASAAAAGRNYITRHSPVTINVLQSTITGVAELQRFRCSCCPQSIDPSPNHSLQDHRHNDRQDCFEYCKPYSSGQGWQHLGNPKRNITH